MEIRNGVNRFNKTLVLLEKLNTKCSDKILSHEEIQEQFDNIKDFEKLLQDYDQLIQKFDCINLDNRLKVDEMLAELHYILNTYNWHISEIHSLVVKIFKEYSKSLPG